MRDRINLGSGGRAPEAKSQEEEVFRLLLGEKKREHVLREWWRRHCNSAMLEARDKGNEMGAEDRACLATSVRLNCG